MLMCAAAVNHAFFPDKLCARRILCFLKRRHLHGAAHQLERETAVFFDMSHLRYLATTARWDELSSYIQRFLPSPTSLPATLFLHRLHSYQVLGTIADGGKRINDIDRLYPLLDDTAAKDRPHVAALRIFFHDVRKRPPRDVASWMQVWKTAAEKLEKLALKCPELKGKLHLPHSPHYAPKRWQINLSGVRPTRKAYKEKGNKPKACDIRCFYEQKRQEINKRFSVPPSRSGFSSNETSGSIISDMQIELAVPQAPGADTSCVAGMLGGDSSLGKEEVDASKSKKRKMSAMSETASLACHLAN
ncbi:hypothetical protein EJB05_21671 [Eragrostis curvula]|uniref:Uncharacterized protein n=1 Tax=Eragrostis curvula TaxID=38414 RepID=A0A5J9V2D9_9POAL|nr:hypothetical protein EJB05_21671 [Eragrostis curvula]